MFCESCGSTLPVAGAEDIIVDDLGVVAACDRANLDRRKVARIGIAWGVRQDILLMNGHDSARCMSPGTRASEITNNQVPRVPDDQITMRSLLARVEIKGSCERAREAEFA